MIGLLMDELRFKIQAPLILLATFENVLQSKRDLPKKKHRRETTFNENVKLFSYLHFVNKLNQI